VSSYQLALFPLPLVLFPGTPLPLHIFEPRYREMLADCRAGDERFGLILTTGGDERELPRGRVGCVAELRDVQMLPDGRANILVEGTNRFALERFVDTPHAYHVALVSDYDDEPGDDPTAVDAAARHVRATFDRVARAARTIADDDDDLPEMPDDATLLSFRIASLVDFDRTERQALLTSRSPLARLRDIDTLLGRALGGLEERAATHARARGNGHGPRPVSGTT
jgi:Lon protease-like protein